MLANPEGSPLTAQEFEAGGASLLGEREAINLRRSQWADDDAVVHCADVVLRQFCCRTGFHLHARQCGSTHLDHHLEVWLILDEENASNLHAASIQRREKERLGNYAVESAAHRRE
jgi:hypothetical protein